MSLLADSNAYYRLGLSNVKLATEFMPKVIINGPECSGKTTLCEYLVKNLDAGYIQEYPRIYLEMTNGKYGKVDLGIMADDINDLIEELDDQRLWIIDTNNINIKIWYQYKYGELPNDISKMDDNVDAIHLLCKPDIPWEVDALRENPEDRDEIYDMYRKYMYESEIKYHIIEGENRSDEALSIIQSFNFSL